MVGSCGLLPNKVHWALGCIESGLLLKKGNPKMVMVDIDIPQARPIYNLGPLMNKYIRLGGPFLNRYFLVNQSTVLTFPRISDRS